jgi:hypothetical protein
MIPSPAEHSDFDRAAVRQGRHDGRQPFFDKIDVLDGCARFVKDLLLHKRDRLQVRTEAFEFGLRQRAQHAVSDRRPI